MKTFNIQYSTLNAQQNIRPRQHWMSDVGCWMLNVSLISAIALFTGCSKSNEATAPNSSPAQKQFVIGMSQCNLGEPWRVQMNADIAAAAAKHPELKVIFKDAQNDTLQQRAQVEEFASAKVDVLIISPKEAQPLTEPVAHAMAAGIPVIVLDRRLLGTNYTCFIGADNKKIGKAAGQWIVKALQGKGNVVELMGLQTSTPGQDRHSGFLEGIAGSGLQVIFRADMQWLEPKARQEMESALARFDKIDCVFAHNDDGAHGAYLAAKAAGREKQMKFVGIDALPQEGVAYVRQGILDATFQYPTGGAEAIDTALKILHGEPVPKEIVLGTRLFDKDNVAQGGVALN
ncbi:MAG TPA: substrate-binding domain-containing protein [Verrucomicrobiae bacterium]|nr:substrate-binding domain-containing protein [Verrucomicrobiae bacterium]